MIRQPSNTKGCCQQPELIAQAIEDEWYQSGDVARRNAEYLHHIVDRAKYMIVSGGDNIDSAEIGNFVSTYPSAASVAVIGAPDTRLGGER